MNLPTVLNESYIYLQVSVLCIFLPRCMDKIDTKTICIANFEVFIESQHQIFESEEEFGKESLPKIRTTEINSQLFPSFSVFMCVVFGYKIRVDRRSFGILLAPGQK